MTTIEGQTYKKERITWIDTAKALLIIFVVLSHVLVIGKVDAFCLSFEVSAFFILSGFTYRRKGLKEHFIIKVKRILIPYYVFSLISIFIMAVIGQNVSTAIGASIKDTSIISNIMGMLYANCKTGYMHWNSSLYFFVLLFCVEVFVNVFENCINKCNEKNKYRIIFILIGFIVSYFLRNREDICLPFLLEACWFFSSLFEIGVITKGLFMKEYNKVFLLIASFVLIVIGYFISINNAPYSIHWFFIGKNYILFIINSLILSTAVFFISKVINFNYILNIIGQNTIGILCMHKFPVLFFSTYVHFFNRIIFSENESLLMIFVALLIVFLSIFLCLLCICVIMNIYPYILGEQRKRNIFTNREQND